jgi:hypothetical protein
MSKLLLYIKFVHLKIEFVDVSVPCICILLKAIHPSRQAYAHMALQMSPLYPTVLNINYRTNSQMNLSISSLRVNIALLSKEVRKRTHLHKNYKIIYKGNFSMLC